MANSTPRHPSVSLLLAGVAAFGTYFCVYAFRKPFTAVDFQAANEIAGLDFKVALVIAQVLGYALSKLLGVKIIGELRPVRRATLLIGLVLAAELALIGFGLVGSHWSALIFLFLNGLPLGLLWGIVFSYIEGRRTTELLGAMLCVSFIVSSGAVKSVGAYLVQQFSVSPYWMPALTGAIFLPLLLLCTLLLERIPPPSLADQQERSPRLPAKGNVRRKILQQLGFGLVCIVLYYLAITILRDLRDNFAPELWSALGYGGAPEVFTLAELPIALLALFSMVIGFQIRDSRKALLYYHGLMLVSAAIILLGTLAFLNGTLAGGPWMVLVGAGLYLGYVPLNAVYFDRVIAAFQYSATAGFLIYVADASGYLGSVSVLLLKNFGNFSISWLDFFVGSSLVVGSLGMVAVALGAWYFRQKLRVETDPSPSLGGTG